MSDAEIPGWTHSDTVRRVVLLVAAWGGPDSADGIEFMISSSFTLDLDPFFTAMQSAAYAAEGLR